MNMIICDECDWRYPEDESQCPRCGENPPEDNMVQQWNSTLKADPQKKPKRSYISSVSKKGNKLKKAMKEVARKHLRETGNMPRCTNCGMRLPELRYSNISHIEKRSLNPELREEVSNMEVLCSAQNFWGKKDESCHTAWERNDFELFESYHNQRTNQMGS